MTNQVYLTLSPKKLIISLPSITCGTSKTYFTPTYSESSPVYMQLYPSSLFNDTGKQSLFLLIQAVPHHTLN